jgi:hypothetical protein
MDDASKKCFQSDDQHAINSCLKEAIENKYVARMAYRKEGNPEKWYNLSNITYSIKYYKCIEAKPSTSHSELTFSIGKIASIEVFQTTNWLGLNSTFGLSEDYSEEPAIPAGPHRETNTWKPTSRLPKEPTSGCFGLIIVGIGSVLSLLYALL